MNKIGDVYVLFIGKAESDGCIYFRVTDDYHGNVAYRTNREGEGLWRQNEYTGEWKQIAGTCQFALHQKTRYGMVRAIGRYFND